MVCIQWSGRSVAFRSLFISQHFSRQLRETMIYSCYLSLRRVIIGRSVLLASIGSTFHAKIAHNATEDGFHELSPTIAATKDVAPRRKVGGRECRRVPTRPGAPGSPVVERNARGA